uniref:ribosomal protein S4 n=1 Tax=Trentepohlia sp. BN17 TaxID=3063876 RepID=UPI001EDFFE0B|nr:ribosomal protein S4 [Trentepohlia sp. BN17]UIB38713.1 ribosomal protein S4 [Trentepohlia sp. BN17]
MRYTGPKVKILRRLDLKELPGLTRKNPMKKRDKENEKKKRPKKQSLYSIRLIEKQKLRFNFCLTNHQFLNYVKRAQKTAGPTGEILIKLLESRFDNIVFRLKLAPTINAARQLITHGHFQINKKKVTIPSYECKINDEILFSSNLPRLEEKKSNQEKLPNYLLWDENRHIGTICQEISLKDPVIIQYYDNLELRILYVIEHFARQL